MYAGSDHMMPTRTIGLVVAVLTMAEVRTADDPLMASDASPEANLLVQSDRSVAPDADQS